MKIISWNVNGLRAIERKGDFEKILTQDADILCFQETKCHPDQLTKTTKNPAGYTSYFSWPTEKKGYSGVAIYTKEIPLEVTVGCAMDGTDDEGRVITAHFKEFIIVNCYFPNGGGGPDRLAYKLDFYDHFLNFIESLRKTNKAIVFCGDVNTAHTPIDLARPKENEKNTGFLPEERAWIDEVIAHGWSDIFRTYYPEATEKYTYWDMKTRARDRNVGWRIDYFFAEPKFLSKIKTVQHLDDVHGSDHCPIQISIG
jgi:exodeoxyribonuclease III